jgi:exportin-2 (importin alpha re-exporter)
VKLPKHSEIFNTEPALKEITERIIIPNLTVRESDEELFEDDPIEYIRRDLEGSDSDTRRRSSIDFLRELKSKNESLVTQVVLSYINHYLQEFQKNSSNWKLKDLSIYLFTALAAKGSLTSTGVSSTNLLLDVVQFFTNNIVGDLMNNNIHPILKVDGIKYIYTFRNQLTKNQLIESFPILTKHLESSEFVEYTYSAITIERILSIRDVESKSLLFKKSDIQPIVQNLLTTLFRLILQSNQSPEKLAENEFLMKTVMRVFIISEDSINSFAPGLLEQLLTIVEIISRNPSNPKFSHFTFESIGVLIKFNHENNWAKFVEIALAKLLVILGSDVQEFVPYVFQIFAYLLEVSPSDTPLPDSFKHLIQPLLSPAVWEFRGNIPAVTRLLRALIGKDPNAFGDLTPLLGVFQKLISSKLNENHGFDLLESIILKFDDNKLANYLKNIAILLLQRLQNSRTEKFVKKLILFISKISIIKSSTYSIQFFEQVQPGIFGTVYEQFLLPSTLNIANLSEKKIVIIGLTNLIASPVFLNGAYSKLLIPTIEILLQLVTTESIQGVNQERDEIAELEFDEVSSFGSNYSRLATIDLKPYDPSPSSINNIEHAKKYFIERINMLNNDSGSAFVNQLKLQLTNQDSLKSLASLGF